MGVAGNVTAKEEKILQQLLIVDSLRGTDSTGVAAIHRKGDVAIAKQVGNPFELLDSMAFKTATNPLSRAIIGHNRWGTIGKSTRANAHPFDFETVVGVHNGTVTTKHKMVDGSTFDVDSQAIYNHINKKGLKDLMQHIDGAWALTWWDNVKEELNFLRNKERPLFITRSEDGKVIYWASEYWMLSGILSRNDVKHGSIDMLPVDVHLTIGVDEHGELSKAVMVPCPSTYVAPHTHKVYHSPAVVAPVKKTGVVTKSATNSLKLVDTSPGSLSNAKQVCLEVVRICNDGYGGRYLELYDVNHKYANIRWYFPRGCNATEWIGEFIICDLGARQDVRNEPSYYKAISSTVEPLDDVTQPDPETLYPDARGEMLKEADWIQRHGECSYCSDLILPSDRHAFSAGYQCFCSSCMKNEEVKSYARFTQLVN